MMTPTTQATKEVIVKQFPLSEICSDAEMKEAGGSTVLTKHLWKKFPSIRNEFVTFETFSAYAQSMAAGHTGPSRGPCVYVGDPQGKF